MRARFKLGHDLIIPTELRLEKRKQGDKREIYSTFPRNVKAIVIHKKLVSKELLVECLSIDNVCIEVTLLFKGGVTMENYAKTLFIPAVVQKWCISSSNSLICHQF